MKEIIFVVEESPEGGCVAEALGASIVTQSDQTQVQNPSRPARRPNRLHFTNLGNQ